MFVFGIVTTADMPADQAQPQVNPAIAHLDTLLAHVRIRLRDRDLVKVHTLLCH